MGRIQRAAQPPRHVTVLPCHTGCHHKRIHGLDSDCGTVPATSEQCTSTASHVSALESQLSSHTSAPRPSPADPFSDRSAALCLASLCQVVSPLLVYPVKFACLYSLYRFFSCSACHLSPSPPSSSSLTSSVLHSTLCASLSGFVVSLPHLSPRLSLVHVVGCGGVGTVASVAQLVLTWLSETSRAVPADSTKRTAPRAAEALSDKQRENG